MLGCHFMTVLDNKDLLSNEKYRYMKAIQHIHTCTRTHVHTHTPALTVTLNVTLRLENKKRVLSIYTNRRRKKTVEDARSEVFPVVNIIIMTIVYQNWYYDYCLSKLVL
jgi:hypothetical protein